MLHLAISTKYFPFCLASLCFLPSFSLFLRFFFIPLRSSWPSPRCRACFHVGLHDRGGEQSQRSSGPPAKRALEGPRASPGPGAWQTAGWGAVAAMPGASRAAVLVLQAIQAMLGQSPYIPSSQEGTPAVAAAQSYWTPTSQGLGRRTALNPRRRP
ncbi:hypothetical protein J3F83DRAFT_733135 [Trichoderma novae-zelandiae]